MQIYFHPNPNLRFENWILFVGLQIEILLYFNYFIERFRFTLGTPGYPFSLMGTRRNVFHAFDAFRDETWRNAMKRAGRNEIRNCKNDKWKNFSFVEKRNTEFHRLALTISSIWLQRSFYSLFSVRSFHLWIRNWDRQKEGSHQLSANLVCSQFRRPEKISSNVW